MQSRLVLLLLSLVLGAAHGTTTDDCLVHADGTTACGGGSTDDNATTAAQKQPQQQQQQQEPYQRFKFCHDVLHDCDTRLENDACLHNFDFMSRKCAKTCRICSTHDPNPKTIASHKKVTVDRIFSSMPQVLEGETSIDSWLHIRETEDYMYNTVYVDSKFQDVRGHCQLRNERCIQWAVEGECTKNPSYMTTACAPACASCLQVKFENRCPLNQSGPTALSRSGDLYHMFHRILTDPQFAPYEPQALSQPTNATVDDAPWLLVLEHVLTPAECQTLIGLAHGLTFKQSGEAGSTVGFDGLKDAVRSERRTSSTTWCRHQCHKDPVTRAVHKRIEALTGIPQENYEYLQLLK